MGFNSAFKRLNEPSGSIKYTQTYINPVDRDGSVGMATRYGLDGPGIENPGRGEIFRARPDRPWGPPTLLYNVYRVFPGAKATEVWR